MSEQLTPEVVERIEVLRSALATYTATEIDKAEFNSLIYSNTPALLAAVRERDIGRKRLAELERNNAALDACVCPGCDRANGRIAELEGALKLARSHVISHHAAHLNGGELGWCPVCHKEDGTEPEMDLIDSALKGGAK